MAPGAVSRTQIVLFLAFSGRASNQASPSGYGRWIAWVGLGRTAVMDAGVHLPLIDFGGEGFSYRRLAETVDAARECGFAAISANDHFLFSAPWLDGLTALAAVAERSGGMKLVTTLALASLRGPVPLAKAFSALDILSGGRVIAGVGPGSSRADYEAVG